MDIDVTFKDFHKMLFGRTKRMEINTSMRIRHTTNNLYKSFNKNMWSAPKRCPFCGHVLKQIDGSNIKICVNKDCESSQDFYKLV